MYVCICKGITEDELRAQLAARLGSADELIEVLGLDDPGLCGRCPASIREHFDDMAEVQARQQSYRRSRMGMALSNAMALPPA